MNDWKYIVLLSADALRADHLSCYGYHRKTSPELDELAQESYQFMNAYSVSSHTREAVPGLLTGEYPDVAVDSDYHLQGCSIATSLSEESFATAAFHSNPFISRAYGFDDGFDVFNDDLHFGQHKLFALLQRAWDKLRGHHYVRAEDINRRALSWLDRVEAGQPFFVWNHYMDTHGPYEPPTDYAAIYRDSDVSKRNAGSVYRRAINDPESVTDSERELLRDLYDAEIRYTDHYIGEFIESLRNRGVLDRTLLIVTSDHGDAFGEHGYYEHPRFLHEEITRVPLLVRPPGGMTGEISTPVSTLDVAATIRSGINVNDSSVGTPLFKVSEDNRIVFCQVRGEDEEDHLRRYGARTQQDACFCERNRETGTVEFTECTSPSLRSELETHIEERISREQTEDESKMNDIEPEIERRLNALGYKE